MDYTVLIDKYGLVLTNILTLMQMFIVLIGIFIAYKIAMFVYKGLIMQTIRKYIKLKL